MDYSLNQNAWASCRRLIENAGQMRVEVLGRGPSRVLDLGITTPGSLEAGRLLAEVCMSGLGAVEISHAYDTQWAWPLVITRTDHPVSACMASQYAGWQVSDEDYFAMGSGPMRAAAGREELFERIGYQETSDVAVGILESGKLPPERVCARLASDCGVQANNLTLLVAPTAQLGRHDSDCGPHG